MKIKRFYSLTNIIIYNYTYRQNYLGQNCCVITGLTTIHTLLKDTVYLSTVFSKLLNSIKSLNTMPRGTKVNT